MEPRGSDLDPRLASPPPRAPIPGQTEDLALRSLAHPGEVLARLQRQGGP